MDHNLIFYQFSRIKVERGGFSHFLSLHAPDKLPTGRRLRELMGRFLFCVEGYDTDPREIHPMPEAGASRNVATTYEPLDLTKFVSKDFVPVNEMCERAEMFEARIHDRTKAVFESFDLPFDAEPPSS